MIFVNYGCGGYSVWEHAIWNGLLLSDLVFPWFMWIMGVCIPISVSSILKKDISKKSTLKNIVRVILQFINHSRHFLIHFQRSLILFGLGLFLTSGPYLDTLRIFGVLQRFGICYLVTATSFIIFSKGLKVLNENVRIVVQKRITSNLLTLIHLETGFKHLERHNCFKNAMGHRNFIVTNPFFDYISTRSSQL